MNTPTSRHMTQQPKMKVDWTVPIWGVVGLAIQSFALVWFLSGVSSHVTENATRIEKVENRIAVLEQTNATIARLDERTKWIYDRLAEEGPPRR